MGRGICKLQISIKCTLVQKSHYKTDIILKTSLTYVKTPQLFRIDVDTVHTQAKHHPATCL